MGIGSLPGVGNGRGARPVQRKREAPRRFGVVWMVNWTLRLIFRMGFGGVSDRPLVPRFFRLFDWRVIGGGYSAFFNPAVGVRVFRSRGRR